MLAEHVKKAYLEGDYNCAETILLAANEEYGLNLPEGSHKLVSAFGAGMGCRRACGAVCGALAVLGCLRVDERAHATEGFNRLSAGLVEKVEKECGCSIDCAELMPIYRTGETRCLNTILKIAEVLEAYVEETK